MFDVCALDGGDINYTWICDVHADAKDDSFVFCANLDSVDSMVSGPFCVFQNIVYDIQSITRGLSRDGCINLRLCFGANTREHPDVPGGWEVRFNELRRNGEKLIGSIETGVWGRRSVTIHPASTLSVSDRANRLIAQQYHRSPPSAVANDDATKALAWTCARCGITREPGSNESSKCARRQTFIGESAPSFYRRFSSTSSCGRILCGLSREQHFRSGWLLLCPRYYECCLCLPDPPNLEVSEDVDIKLGWCLQCRARHASRSGDEATDRGSTSPAGGSRSPGTRRRGGSSRRAGSDWTGERSPSPAEWDGEDADADADEMQVPSVPTTRGSHRRAGPGQATNISLAAATCSDESRAGSSAYGSRGARAPGDRCCGTCLSSPTRTGTGWCGRRTCGLRCG